MKPHPSSPEEDRVGTAGCSSVLAALRVLYPDVLAPAGAGAGTGAGAVLQSAATETASHDGIHPAFLQPKSWAWAQADLAALEAALRGRDVLCLPSVPPFAVRHRQLAFVAGRMCAELALLQAGAHGPCSVLRGASGQPVWPRGWTGSITHISRFALAVATRREGAYDLGIDAEQLIAARTQPAVLQTCVHSSEQQLLAAAARPELALTVLFSAKEAYFKAVYGQVRRFIDFKEVALAGWSPSEGSFHIGPAPGAAAKPDWPQVKGWFVEQGGEVVAVLGPGYG